MAAAGESPVFVMAVAPVATAALVSTVIAAIWHLAADDR